MSTIVVRCENVHKEYVRGSVRIPILCGVNLEIQKGEFVSLVGPSGSGKTTLLNLLAGLDQPTSGDLTVAGHSLGKMNEAELARWRSIHVGFVFQSYHLIPVFTAYENVELPLLRWPISASKRREHVLQALELVGLAERAKHRPLQMSGGEQQRVGIARALVTDPSLIVADEPTGNLDADNSRAILDLLEALQSILAKTIVLVTHDPTSAARAQRQVRMQSGRLLERRLVLPNGEAQPSTPTPLLDQQVLQCLDTPV